MNEQEQAKEAKLLAQIRGADAYNEGYDNGKRAVLQKIQQKIEYLYTHNKNYTRKQWEAVLELQENIKDIENSLQNTEVLI